MAAWVAGAMLAFDVVWGWRLARGLAVERRLTVEDRLGVVEEFQAPGLGLDRRGRRTAVPDRSVGLGPGAEPRALQPTRGGQSGSEG